MELAEKVAGMDPSTVPAFPAKIPVVSPEEDRNAVYARNQETQVVIDAQNDAMRKSNPNPQKQPYKLPEMTTRRAAGPARRKARQQTLSDEPFGPLKGGTVAIPKRPGATVVPAGFTQSVPGGPYAAGRHVGARLKGVQVKPPRGQVKAKRKRDPEEDVRTILEEPAMVDLTADPSPPPPGGSWGEGQEINYEMP